MKSDLARVLASKAFGVRNYTADKKWAGRGTSGKKQNTKAKQSSQRMYNTDKNLIKTYGKDAMKSRGFAQQSHSPTKTSRVKKKK